MKTKTIPFDLDTAKKIQAGEIEGKIKTKNGYDISGFYYFDKANSKIDSEYPVYCCVNGYIQPYTIEGSEKGFSRNNEWLGDLILEVPDNEPQFKPFDKVLVRDRDYEVWRISLYESCGNDGFYVLHGLYYSQCIPYAGNENLVGTTDKPKEE